MGWNQGSEIFDIIIKICVEHIPDKETRKKIYEPIFNSFCEQDWDTENECLGQDDAYDEVCHDWLEAHGLLEDEDDDYEED